MSETAAVTTTTTETTEPKKWVVNYQATDSEGNPIGRPTHLEAETPEELIEKQKNAHIAATQALWRQNKAFEDLKHRKAQPLPAPKAVPQTQEEKNADYENRLVKTEDELRFARGQATGYAFMRNHSQDYWPCDANSAALAKWVTDNGYEFTVDALEIAFAAIGDDLAKDPRPKTSATTIPTNGPTTNEQTATPTAQPQAQQQRQPSFGVEPGTGTGARPTGAQTGQMTKKRVIELRKKDPKEFRRRLNDPKLKAEMDAALARG